MKHTAKVTIFLVTLFLVTQLIGIFVAHAYLPETVEVLNQTTGEIDSIEQYDLPYGLDPPAEVQPVEATTSIIIALIIAVVIMLTLMKLRAETFLRLWFLLVVILGIAIAVNAFLISVPSSAFIALAVAIPLGILKIFHRNIIVHNVTEALIYPGIAIVFIPLLNIWAVVILLFIISFYDMYAVWHAGFMQKMAKYQIETLKVFSGFFVPYLSKGGKTTMKGVTRAKQSKKKIPKNAQVDVAILGGGDVVFPILLAGVVLGALGLTQSIIIALGATAALGFLFYISEKGKFYPAMPFITIGCLIALGIALII